MILQARSKIGIHKSSPHSLIFITCLNYGHLNFYPLLKTVTPLLWQLKKKCLVYVLLDMPRNGGEEKESSNSRDYYKYQNIKDDLIHSATLTWMAFVVRRQTYHPPKQENIL